MIAAPPRHSNLRLRILKRKREIRTDVELTGEVLNILRRQLPHSIRGLDVTVDKGVITVRGDMIDEPARWGIIDSLKSIDGADGIALDLQLQSKVPL